VPILSAHARADCYRNTGGAPMKFFQKTSQVWVGNADE
jgi:hypothetical protein